MQSRLLSKLEGAIAAAGEGHGRDDLRAERAAYLARVGRIEAARQEVEDLRHRNAQRSCPRLSILTSIADGLCHYYDDMGREARDRFMRAHALAHAVGQRDLAAQAAGWLSLVHYGDHDFAGMSRCLDESLQGALRSSDQGTLARSSLVVALTLHLANRFDLAIPWYRRARLFAAEIEDEATISALMHNMASIWAANARNASLGGPPTSDSSRQALMGALSTLHFDERVGLSALAVFTPLLQAQVLSLEGRFGEALAFYRDHLGALGVEAERGWQVWLVADRGWCELELGYRDAARVSFEAAAASLSEDHHVDDLAATMSRLAAGFERLGRTEESHKLLQRARQHWTRFELLQSDMIARLQRCEGVTKMEAARTPY